MNMPSEEIASTVVLDENTHPVGASDHPDDRDLPLTVLNISQNYYIRGGSDRYFFVMGKLLEAHGHRVIPFAARQAQDEPTSWSEYFPEGIDFQSPSALDVGRFIYSRRAAHAIERLLNEHPADIAHLQIYYGQLTASILAPLRRAGMPVVQTIHDLKLVCPVYSLMSHGKICEACQGKHFWKGLVKRCNRGSLTRSALSVAESYASRWLGAVDHVDRFISVSHFQRDKLVELGVPAEKITVVHNFIDVETNPTDPVAGDYLLYFGRIERLKGIYTLIDAAKRATDVKLVLVGEGDAYDEVRELIRERGLNHVELRGFAKGDELKQLVRGSLATILPSEGYDNCPMAVLESLGMAKAVIGSRIGGIPELIDDAQDGFLVPPGDGEALADRMNWMWNHRREVAEMGMRGREKVVRRFNSQTHYDRIADVYRDVLARAAAS